EPRGAAGDAVPPARAEREGRRDRRPRHARRDGRRGPGGARERDPVAARGLLLPDLDGHAAPVPPGLAPATAPRSEGGGTRMIYLRGPFLWIWGTWHVLWLAGLVWTAVAVLGGV